MQNMRSIALIVDSAICLPDTFAQRSDVIVVPMAVTIFNTTYMDRRDITSSEFYRLQKESNEIPTTAAPSPGRFIQAFQLALDQAESVLCLTVSPKFSSTFNCATLAEHEIKKERPDAKLKIIDTESASGGAGLIVTAACRAIDNGKTVQEVVKTIKSIIPRVFITAYLDNLYYAWKSGRIPKLAYAASSVLGIKPVFQMHRGLVKVIGRPTSKYRAQQRIIRDIKSQINGSEIHAVVIHAGEPQAAKEMKSTLHSDFRCDELYISEFSPAMTAHTGPGLLGVSYWNKKS